MTLRPSPALRGGVLTLCLVLMGISVAWVYWPMRDVMAIGGTCAEGGPYVIETPCPQGAATFLTLGIPLFMLSVFLGFIALTLKSPLPVFPGWALLFGALGWNFVDFGLNADPSGRPVASWLVCGVVFWVMALPAVVIFLGWPIVQARIANDGAPRDERPTTSFPNGAWLPIYVLLLAAGWWLGTLSLNAWT